MPYGIRKNCNDAGYESVLLIPLRVGENTLGLIQLNHKKEDYFTQTFILLMERLVDHIAVIISKFLAEEKLKIKQDELEETNTALKIILKNREQELQEHNQEILMNVRQLVLPCIDRLKLSNIDIRQKSQLQILENNLQTITSPFSKKLSSESIALTPSLIQISDMIKKGLKNKEIAKLLAISVQSVETYRKRIRARLKLKNSKVNLRAYLMKTEDWDI
jgi:DNA-binding NarL/FixJ family response regulator